MAKQTPHRAQAVFALGLVAILTLAGCSASSDSSAGTESLQKSLTSEGSLRKMDGGIVPSDGGAKLSTEDGAANTADDKTAEILTASLSLRVKDPSETAATIRAMVSSVDGKVSYSVERPGSEFEYGSAQLTLRLAPDSLQGVMEAIKDYGVVVNSESGSQDVTKQKTDYEVRIESLKTSIARLNGLIAESKTTADLIEIERELQSRESELESMNAVLAELNDSIDYATLNITLTAESKDSQPKKVDPENFFTGLQRGFEGLAAFGSSLLVILGISLPWILILAVVGSIVMIFLTISRKRRRRNRAQTPAAVIPEQTEDGTAAEATKGSDGPAQEG